MTNKLYQKALEYSLRGYSVLPVRSNKIPFVTAWKKFQNTPADDKQIEDWWQMHPQANVGIITGRISGITVVDIDTTGGAAVPLDAFPKTYTVKTPTGGYHLYYAYDASIAQTANTFPQFPHVDIRNDGGYVLAPPSHCDYQKAGAQVVGDYTVERNLPVAPFPTLLFHSKQQETKNPATKRAAELLKEFSGMEEGDGRNNALAKVIGKFLKVLPVSEFESTGWQMALAANSQFKMPLPEKEVKTTFQSIVKKERSKPLSKVEFLKDKEGDIIVNEENLFRLIKADELLSGHFRYNTFANVVETDFRHDEWGPLQRADVVEIQTYMMSTYPYLRHVKHGMVEDSILKYVQTNKVSPPVEWMRSLVWDNKPRLDVWLSKTYGTPEDEYHAAVASNWMKGLVKRIVHPGCKFDYVLVLEGKQGLRKSMSLAVLGGKYHVETVFTPDNKDFFMLLSGHAIVEFSEGETLSRTEAKRLKAVITMQKDKFRPPYERNAQEFARQCVFAMTTNQEQYLKDETGNRRWLPVRVEKTADIAWLERNREQLYAEAYHRAVTLKEKTYEFPEEETRAQQAARQTTDPREEQVYEWYFNLTDAQRDIGITTREAFVCGVQGLQIETAQWGKPFGKMEEMLMASILREVLCLDKRRGKAGGNRFYKYYPTRETMKLAPEKDEPIAVQKMKF